MGTAAAVAAAGATAAVAGAAVVVVAMAPAGRCLTPCVHRAESRPRFPSSLAETGPSIAVIAIPARAAVVAVAVVEAEAVVEVAEVAGDTVVVAVVAGEAAISLPRTAHRRVSRQVATNRVAR